MESFIIEGGHRLSGTIAPQGAKNEALEVICATLLTTEEVIIRNIPNILDVNNLIKLLQDIGVKVKKLGANDFSFQADEVKLDYLESIDFVKKCSSLRGSVLMIGPLLGRFGKATIAKPGGDKIGRRRLDTHFLGFKTWEHALFALKIVTFMRYKRTNWLEITCYLMRLLLQEQQILSCQLSWLRGQRPSIMLLVSLTYSSYAIY